jgi:NAD(P)H-hydrate epimerase
MTNTESTLTRQQVRRVDELAVTDLKFPSIILMENAGRNAAEWIQHAFPNNHGHVHIFCGTGNNGGDGFVIARRLRNAGRRVRIYLVGDIERMSPDTSTNHDIAQAMGMPIAPLSDEVAIADAGQSIAANDLVVDALLGTGFAGEVREPLAAVIRQINMAASRDVVAVDVPSGVDCDTGAVNGVAVKAAATVTFVAAKRGFQANAARDLIGHLVVVDIGTPPSLLRRVLAETTP